jgi:NADPH-dependent 2,4-dienoyl-CoA reductase/sulfur reductase-like enzyme
MKIIIIGAGPAGVSAAETVRSLDANAELLVFSAEPYPPYSPPAMVDHFLTGSDTHLWRGEDWPQRMDVDYRCGQAVTSVDPLARKISMPDGEQIGFDKLVIATGGRLYAPLDGASLPGVYNFKSLLAAENLIRRVRSGEARSALIVGAGFIGMEIALLLRDLGLQVTQIEMMEQVMPAMLDADTAAIAQNIMLQRGIDLRLNTRALAFTGSKQADGLLLESGERLQADLYVAATGVRPNLEFLEGSGVAHGWGIQVDDYLCTNNEHIYAAGDVIESKDRLTGERFVHPIFPNAVEQGHIVGLNLLGFQVPYAGADRMNSLKHLGLPIMVAGRKDGDEVYRVRRQNSLRSLYLEGDRLVGFQLVRDTRAAGILRSLLNEGRDLHGWKDQLVDPNFSEGTLISRAFT